MTDWYYHDPAQGRVGPLSDDDLRKRFRERRIERDTLVWRDGLREWQPFERVFDEIGLDSLVQDTSSPPPMRATASGAAFEAVSAGAATDQTQWYYSDYERNRLGPVRAKDLAELHENGQLAPDTLVWREGYPQWQSWQVAMGEVLAAAPRPPGAAPPSAGMRRSADDDAWDQRSPYAPPRAALASSPGVHQGGEVVYAGFWKRVAASVLDSIVLGVIGAAVGGVVGGIMGVGGSSAIAIQAVAQLVSLGVQACYFAFFHASGHQATPGKMAVGIKVVRSDGETIGFLRGIGRYFAYLLSGLILLIGLVMAGFTDRKRALHDMLCDTLVVDKWAFTATPERQRPELGTVAIVVLTLSALLLVGIFLLAAIGISALGGLGR